MAPKHIQPAKGALAGAFRVNSSTVLDECLSWSFFCFMIWLARRHEGRRRKGQKRQFYLARTISPLCREWELHGAQHVSMTTGMRLVKPWLILGLGTKLDTDAFAWC